MIVLSVPLYDRWFPMVSARALVSAQESLHVPALEHRFSLHTSWPQADPGGNSLRSTMYVQLDHLSAVGDGIHLIHSPTGSHRRAPGQLIYMSS